jgi:hypothetical protein
MVAQLVKGLKPKKLRIDQVRLRILNELRAEGRAVKKEFEKTTATWKGAKPTFEIAIGLTGQDAIVIIGPAGNPEGAQKWVWLDEGTKKNYPIVAKNVRTIKRKGKTIVMPPMLTFRDGRGFKAKTKVKTFSSGPGANTGDWVSKEKVIHPGIEARDWSGEIAKRRRKPFTKRILKAAQV